MKRICLFLNGRFEHSQFKIKIENEQLLPCHLVKNFPKNIQHFAADGGLNHILARKFPIENLVWVGDGDSLNKKSVHFLRRYQINLTKNNSTEEKIIRLQKNKNFSDLAVILDKILLQNNKQALFLEIYGGLGNRRDHEFANREEIKNFLSLLPCGGTVFFHGGLVITSLPIKFLEAPCPFFSLFDNKKPIEVKGAKYSGSIELQRPSHGLSNEVKKKTLYIAPSSGSVTIYFEE